MSENEHNQQGDATVPADNREFVHLGAYFLRLMHEFIMLEIALSSLPGLLEPFDPSIAQRLRHAINSHILPAAETLSAIADTLDAAIGHMPLDPHDIPDLTGTPFDGEL